MVNKYIKNIVKTNNTTLFEKKLLHFGNLHQCVKYYKTFCIYKHTISVSKLLDD